MASQIPEGHPLRKLRPRGWRFGGQLALLFGAMSLVWGGCAQEDDDYDPTATRPYALFAFNNCDSLDDYLTDLGVDLFTDAWVNGGYYGYDMARGGAVNDVGVPSMEGTDDQSGGEAPPADPTEYTTTNVQEAGVDELDLVKTDGNTIYYVQNNVLHIIDSWPAEDAVELATVQLDGWGESIFLQDDVIVAFTNIDEGGYGYCDYGYCDGPMPVDAEPREEPATEGDEGDPEPGDEPPHTDGDTDEPSQPFSAVRATIIDVSDPSDPQIVRTMDFEGSMASARLVDGIVYLAAISEPSYYDPDLFQAFEDLDLPDAWELTYEQRQAMESQIAARVRPIIADWVATNGRAALIPDLRVDGGERADMFSCSDIMRSGHRSDFAALSVIGFDPTIDDDPSGVALLARGWHVYGSQSNLYIAQDSRWWWWPNPELKITETNIHQFALNGGEPQYLASGKVPGWALNQFSMSEFDGYLRIATTDQTLGGWFWGEGDAVEGGVPSTTDAVTGSGTTSNDDEPPVVEPDPEPEPEPGEDANNVFVLQRNGQELEVVGQVRGMAPGEQIFAVRFLGNKGYVVTYEQVDPLFVLDLSEPTQPVVKGELHITGFSTYLHPISENHLIGVGREGTETGQTLGFQLQLFDVSDPTNPTRIHQEVLSTGNDTWSYSEAEHDHHAFTYYASRDLLAIPVTLEDWSWDSDDYSHFSGIIVYRVSVENGFEELGRVSHTGFTIDTYCSDEQRVDPEADYACETFEYPWYSWMRRSTFIEDYLYAFSNMGVTASHLDDIETPVASIPIDDSGMMP